MRMASGGGSWGGMDPRVYRETSCSASAKLFHHESGSTTGDMGDDGRAAMDLGDQPQVDREGEVHLLSLAQAQILRLHVDAVGAQVLGLANAALASGHDDVHGGARAVPSVQSTLHPGRSFEVNSWRALIM